MAVGHTQDQEISDLVKVKRFLYAVCYSSAGECHKGPATREGQELVTISCCHTAKGEYDLTFVSHIMTYSMIDTQGAHKNHMDCLGLLIIHRGVTLVRLYRTIIFFNTSFNRNFRCL